MPRAPLLCVATQIPNRANGGIESFTQILSNLTRYRPTVITNVESPRTGQWRAMGVEVHVLPERASGTSVRSAPLKHVKAYRDYGFAVRRLTEPQGNRLVYVNDPLAMQFVYPLARMGRIKVAFALRNMPDPGIRQSGRKYRTLFGACEHLLFLSEDMARRWRELAGPFVRPHSVTYSIVDHELFGQPRIRDDDRPFVLVPARITPSKRQLEFIENAGSVIAAAGLRILFAGDASSRDAQYERACRKAAEPLGDAVEFLGYRDDLQTLYAQASVIVVAARLEGLARAMIEGMACGCPVVSFDVCSAHEILDGGSGIVVADQDWDAMASAILALCASPDRLEAMGKKARAEAKRLFRSDKVIERYESAFDRAAAAR